MSKMGWEVGGRFKREGMYVYKANSLCCTAEINTILKNNFTLTTTTTKKL